MKRALGTVVVLGGLAVATWLVLGAWMDVRLERPGAADAAAVLPAAKPAPLPAGDKVAFLELGSVGCKPCEAMKPVMQAVRERFPDQVEVTFYDVRKRPAVAGKYGVRLIPTQVFLRPDGTEFSRHEGYFAEDRVFAVLAQMGVR